MRKSIYLISLCVLCSCTVTVDTDFSDEESDEIVFDAELAAETGADDYGMRKYVIAYLKDGPNRDQDSTEAAQIQRAHQDNIVRMAEMGKLVLAGPYMDNHGIQGIYIFAVETLEEAEELTNTDPAVQAGRLELELHPWYGSAALMKVNEMHTKISKEKI